ETQTVTGTVRGVFHIGRELAPIDFEVHGKGTAMGDRGCNRETAKYHGDEAPMKRYHENSYKRVIEPLLNRQPNSGLAEHIANPQHDWLEGSRIAAPGRRPHLPAATPLPHTPPGSASGPHPAPPGSRTPAAAGCRTTQGRSPDKRPRIGCV